jgi:AraC-like DNA-binding protein
MSSHLLSSSFYSTKHVDSRDRFEAYRQYMAPLADLEPLDGPISTAVFELRAWEMADLTFVRETNPGAKFSRSRQKVKTSPNDHYYIYMIQRGENLLVSNRGRGIEHRMRGRQGSVALHSMIDVSHGFMRDIACQMVFLPRDLFGANTSILDKNINRVFGGPVGRLLVDFLGAIDRDIDQMTMAHAEVFSRSLVELLKASLGPEDAPSLAPDLLEHVSKARIRHYIAANLSDRLLTPERICRDVGISRASLYRLFEPEGGVANYILACRLERASKSIKDPNEFRNLHQIAVSLGFRSGAELSRSFKRRFEVTPSDLRSLHVAKAEATDDAVDFNRLLTRLGQVSG